MEPDIKAAGAVLWRPSRKHGIKVALVHRPRYKDWSLPKGKMSAGETWTRTAAREVTEETGFTCRIGRSLTSVSYLVSGRPKTVQYFAARAGRGEFTANREVDALEWLPLLAARRRLTYAFDKAVLDTFALHPADLGTLVLVRHAKAGVRESWPGQDHDRPLDAVGTAQAEALATELAVFGAEQIHSAPPERCRATVRPLASRLGLPVHREVALGEESYRHDPAQARKRVTALAAPDRAVIACSQGGVIPGVLRSLASRADLTLGKTSTPKAAYWVLSFDDQRLVQADPYPAP